MLLWLTSPHVFVDLRIFKVICWASSKRFGALFHILWGTTGAFWFSVFLFFVLSLLLCVSFFGSSLRFSSLVVSSLSLFLFCCSSFFVFFLFASFSFFSFSFFVWSCFSLSVFLFLFLAWWSVFVCVCVSGSSQIPLGPRPIRVSG